MCNFHGWDNMASIQMTTKEKNAKELQRAWKKFMRTQNEKAKTEKENQKAEEKGELVSQAYDQQHHIKHNEGENKCLIK